MRSEGTLWISRSLVLRSYSKICILLMSCMADDEHILNNLLGKFVVGYMPVCGEKEYYLACACGELYAPPSAYVALFGLTVQQTFLRGNFLYKNDMKHVFSFFFILSFGTLR
jgi:hypothetical protein